MSDVAAVGREERPKGAVVPGEQVLPGVVADHPDQVGRPHDVREHERSRDPLRALVLEREPIEQAPGSRRTRASAEAFERVPCRSRLGSRRIVISAGGVRLRQEHADISGLERRFELLPRDPSSPQDRDGACRVAPCEDQRTPRGGGHRTE